MTFFNDKKRLENDSFLNFLQELSLSNKTIFYRPNTGNAGDALINVGFYEVASSLKLNFRELDNNQPLPIELKNAIVIMPGGGYLVKEWMSNFNLLKKARARNYSIVFAPQSITLEKHLLEQILKDGDLLFCRERQSYQHLESMQLNIELNIANDLAFYVDCHSVMTKRQIKSIFSNCSLEKRIKRLIKLLIIIGHILFSKLNPHIKALRTDQEASTNEKRPWILDLAKVCQFDLNNSQSNYTTAALFLAVIDSYETVETDRLHVLIAAHLLKKKVSFRDNSYGKLRAVFDYTIKG